MKYLFFLICSALLSLSASGQTPGVDKIKDYQFGTNTDFGQSPQFFPQNIFGNPDTNATVFAPTSTENQIVSLGLNGWIIVEFTDNIILDFPGSDFTVFENAFFIGHDTTKTWMEPGVVSVSKNGIDFVTFPYDSVTFQGCAGTKPTNGKVNSQDFSKCGGNQFDLSAIGMDSIRFVKIEDRSRWVNGGNGFDLDAVISAQTILWTSIKSISKKTEDLNLRNYPNPFNPTTSITWNQSNTNETEIKIINILGEVIFKMKYLPTYSGNQNFNLNLQQYSSGVYIVMLNSKNKFAVKQINLIK